MKQLEFEIRITELRTQLKTSTLDFENKKRILSENKKRAIGDYTRKVESEFTQELTELSNNYKERQEQLIKTMNALRAEYLRSTEEEKGDEARVRAV